MLLPSLCMTAIRPETLPRLKLVKYPNNALMESAGYRLHCFLRWKRNKQHTESKLSLKVSDFLLVPPLVMSGFASVAAFADVVARKGKTNHRTLSIDYVYDQLDRRSDTP